MELRYSRQAKKYLTKVPKGPAASLQKELKAAAADWAGYAGDLIKMTNSPYYRLRVGGYRAILEVREGELLLLVLKIGARGDVYK